MIRTSNGFLRPLTLLLFSILLGAVLTFAMAGCSDDDDEPCQVCTLPVEPKPHKPKPPPKHRDDHDRSHSHPGEHTPWAS